MEQNRPISHFRHLWFFTLMSVFLPFILLQCTEDPLKIDPKNILPDDDMLDVIIDTLPVTLYTIDMEAVVTRSVGISPLGSMNDPEIGIIDLDFISDFIYVSEPEFKDETHPDSLQIVDIKMELFFDNQFLERDYFGKADDINFEVYELLEPMPDYTKSDFIIYSHMVDASPLNEGAPYLTLNDSVQKYTVNIKHEFAERLLDTNKINQNIYKSENQRVFKDYFKGFYFKVNPKSNPGGGVIMVDHSTSRIVLRTLNNLGKDEPDTLITNFYIGYQSSAIDSGGVHLNLHRLNLKPELKEIINDTVNVSDHAYLQALAGPKILVKLPSLNSVREMLNNSVSVNRAQLILPYDKDIYDQSLENYSFFAPRRLGLYDSKSNSNLVDDYSQDYHLGGFIDTINNRYVLNIENHIHRYLSNDTNSLSSSFFLFAGTELKPVTFGYIPSRVVLNNAGSQDPPVLRIIYSNIP